MTRLSGSPLARVGAIAIMPRPLAGRSLRDFDVFHDEVLVIRRSLRVVAPGALCFPGGGVEFGESPAEAARREFAEEVGLPIRIASLATVTTTPSGAPLHWFFAEYAGDAFDESAVRLQTSEASEYAWRSLPSLLDDPDFLPNNLAVVRRILSGELKLFED